MQLNTFRTLFTNVSMLAFFLVPRLFTMIEIPYYMAGVIFNGIPMLLLIIHYWAKKKHQQDFDSPAYFHAILCIAILATFGSFSKDELIEFGFHFLSYEPKWAYFALKLSFYFWSILLLPIALDKFFKKA